MIKNGLPLGIFDSGLGGLTALAELCRILPGEDIVYFGDNARIPYGTKSPELIKKFALQDARFLVSRGVKAILVACGTVSSNCLEDIAAETGLPVVGVIDNAARLAAKKALEGNGTVAVLGTSATVKSGAFERALEKEGVKNIISKACPLFVPLAESWHPSEDDPVSNAVACEYLAPIAEKSPAAAILGCTHYPLLSQVIQKQLPGTFLISSGKEAAGAMRDKLSELGMLDRKGGRIEFFTSDDPELFKAHAQNFLGRPVDGEVCKVDIERY